MRMLVRVSAIALFSGMVGVGQVGASTIINTGPPGSGNVAPFGEPNTATYGQTFTAPASDTVLDDFTFWMDDFSNPDFVDFAGYVMGWTGTQATGPILYQSAMRSTTNNGGASGMEQFSFNTGGVHLSAGQQYVAFLSASSFFDGQTGTAAWSLVGNTYAGGDFVYFNNGNNFSLLSTQSWDFVGGIGDTAFRASFSAVPEPATLALLGLGLAGLFFSRRRR